MHNPNITAKKHPLNELIQGDELLFARQPIFDDDENFYAFELLYRDKDPSHALFDDADKATSSLIGNYCGNRDQHADKREAKVFINLTRNILLSDNFFPMEANNMVIEILEDILVDDELVERIISLRTEGYQFALDDYEFSDKFDRLLPLMDYIKVELLPFSEENLTKRMAEFESLQLSQLKRRPALLAEKVESQASYDLCKRLGFDLFQGYFLERPMPIYGRKI